MINLAAIIVAANTSLGVVNEYFTKARGVVYEKIKEEDFKYLLAHRVCRKIEHHFWAGDELMYVVIFNSEGEEIGYFESDKGYKGLNPDKDRVFCNAG